MKETHPGDLYLICSDLFVFDQNSPFLLFFSWVFRDLSNRSDLGSESELDNNTNPDEEVEDVAAETNKLNRNNLKMAGIKVRATAIISVAWF